MTNKRQCLDRLNRLVRRNQQKTIANLKRRKVSDKKYTDISQINEHIFIGNKYVANDVERLEEHGITCVVNCANSLEHYVDDYDESIKWLWLPMHDCSYTGDVETYIPMAISFIDEAIKEGHKILIHCHAGISRSSSITIAYLMYRHNLEYDKAFWQVKNKRYCCRPNSRFEKQLRNYDFSLL